MLYLHIHVLRAYVYGMPQRLVDLRSTGVHSCIIIIVSEKVCYVCPAYTNTI